MKDIGIFIVTIMVLICLNLGCPIRVKRINRTDKWFDIIH